MKKNPWERVVTADGYAPLLFYLLMGLAAVVAGYFFHFWMTFGTHLLGW